jgi:hypothetical protein
MESAKADGQNLDAGFSQRAVRHLPVAAFSTSSGNVGRPGHGRQSADKFTSPDIFRRHFLPSFFIQYLFAWLKSHRSCDRAGQTSWL